MVRRFLATVTVTLSIVLLAGTHSIASAHAETGWGMGAAYVVTSGR